MSIKDYLPRKVSSIDLFNALEEVLDEGKTGLDLDHLAGRQWLLNVLFTIKP